MKNSLNRQLKNSTNAKFWKLGDHRLACGDARDQALVKKLINNTRINAIVSDPPYGVSVVESKAEIAPLRSHKAIINDDISSESEYATFTKDWLTPILPHLAKKNSIYIFNADKMLFALKDGMDEAHVRFSQLVIWVKNHAIVGRKDYLPQHELIVFGWYGTHTFHRSKDKSVIFYPKPNKSPYHPTTKPLGLIRHLILNSTDMGDAVYDGFGGSGTTLLACEQLKRRCFMVEQDEDYCRTIIRRWEAMTKQKAQPI
ncbi:MAG: site-specific DNA-methyltransferase [Desulfobulbaceae bacterium]|nr:site-specific DNA-methyltransferase [Desulfobulbaceae bacterium]